MNLNPKAKAVVYFLTNTVNNSKVKGAHLTKWEAGILNYAYALNSSPLRWILFDSKKTA